MANGKIRLNSSTKYVIEVNDEGECIEIDLNDTSLPAKLMQMIDEINEKQKEFEEEADEILKRENNEVIYEYDDMQITKNFLDFQKAQDKVCEKCRELIDRVFGKDASRKIFGTINNPEMFTEFFELIKPELEKAGVKFQNMQKALVNKFKTENKKVL